MPLHSQDDFIFMRRAGRLAADLLDYIEQFVVAGVTTQKLNQICHDYIIDHGAIPAPLNYRGYPKSICISINEVVCHGIPSERQLSNGDCVNIDVTVIKDGWFGDSSRMYGVGEITAKAQKLIDITYDCLMRGVAAAGPGKSLGDIGHAIQSYAESHRYSVVRDFCGHGIGRVFHDEPTVLHYGKPGRGAILKPGMFFTIEPMINAGGYAVKILEDGWTAITRDLSLSAQWEHTIGITATGAEVFTLSAVERKRLGMDSA
ncbi:MAG: type I methionyl aminopeptidase [Candidatus Pacebacteria bacterium]|nr:type I methionyl aminopeptidase [Candidatus Paceibacterota bacterium]